MRLRATYLTVTTTLLLGSSVPPATAATVELEGVALTLPDPWQPSRQTSLTPQGGRLLGAWQSPPGEAAMKVIVAAVDPSAATSTLSGPALRREIALALATLPSGGEFMSLSEVTVDGVPAYRARFRFGIDAATIETLYVVHAQNTYLLAVMTTGVQLVDHVRACTRIVSQLRIGEEAHWITGVTRAASLGFLAIVAGAALVLRRISKRFPSHELTMPALVVSRRAALHTGPRPE